MMKKDDTFNNNEHFESERFIEELADQLGCSPEEVKEIFKEQLDTDKLKDLAKKNSPLEDEGVKKFLKLLEQTREDIENNGPSLN